MLKQVSATNIDRDRDMLSGFYATAGRVHDVPFLTMGMVQAWVGQKLFNITVEEFFNVRSINI
jgi:hypothetical protein